MAGNLLHFQYFYYNPSLGAAVLFIVLFALSFLVHVYQLIRFRTWYFIPFVIGVIFETIGYVGRAIAAQQAPDFTQNPYIIQSLLILLAPAFFAASIYMILGRLIRLVQGEAYAPISIRWLTPIFVTGDVISFAAQGAGGGLLAVAKDQSGVSLGNNIIIGGLGIQILFFVAFLVTTAIFHSRIQHMTRSSQDQSIAPEIRYLNVLYCASALVLVRNIIRIVEYIQGFDGYMQRHEVFIYVFDALLMFFLVILFNGLHPSKIINGRKQTIQATETKNHV